MKMTSQGRYIRLAAAELSKDPYAFLWRLGFLVGEAYVRLVASFPTDDHTTVTLIAGFSQV